MGSGPLPFFQTNKIVPSVLASKSQCMVSWKWGSEKKKICENYCLWKLFYNRFAALHLMSVLLWNFAVRVSSNIFFLNFSKKYSALAFKVRKSEMYTIILYLLSMLQGRVPMPTIFFFLWNQIVGIGKVLPSDGSWVN